MLTVLYNRGGNMQLGVTLIELLLAIIIFSILIAVGAPNFMTWLQNGQIRTASESIVNGLQRARGEAVSRNSLARFYLCGGSSGDSTWAVLAASAPAAAQPCPGSPSVAGYELVDSHLGSEGSPNATITVTQATTPATTYDALANPITYDGLGRVTPPQPADIIINVQDSKGGSCMPGGPMRCMDIIVSTGGQARMCNPAYNKANNPQGC